MISWKIENDDIVLNELVEGEQEEIQCIERILTTCTDEWFLNIDFGLDYTKIRGKDVSDEQIRVAITLAILQEERVKEIQDISIERDRQKRTITLSIIIKMKSGNIVKVVKDFE